jgi:hypothetical protein
MGTLVRRRWRSGAFYAEKRTGLLTSRRTPLYTARPDSSGQGPCGGIGRRARLKIEFRKECWFDSGQGHQSRSHIFTREPSDPRGRRAPASRYLLNDGRLLWASGRTVAKLAAQLVT